jgi:hypothetical protein
MPIPVDTRHVHLWALTNPLYAAFCLSILGQAWLIAPISVGLAWQDAWLESINETARMREKDRDKA